MSTFTPKFLDEIRSRLTLSEIIGKRIKITSAGREYRACCPFHKEKSPSFYINDEKDFYHCFGCGAHGDAIGFSMQYDNLSFPEAVENLAALAGLEVPKQTPIEYEKAKQEKSLYSLIEDTTKFFEKSLYQTANSNSLEYLKKRNIPEEMLNAFRLGVAPSDGRELIKYLSSLDYTDNQMIEAGVARKSKKNGSLYSFFRDRIIFPVSDRRGRVVAFGGRILPENIRPDLYANDSKPPKYINSSDNPLFHKGQMLFAETRARQAAIEEKPIIVVEGYVDVMACNQAGFTGAVAPLGTALTEEQILRIWKMIPDMVKVPYLCFDGDNAGKRAAARACERILPLLKPDHTVRIIFLPDGHDPDSYIRSKGSNAFSDLIDQSISLIDFMWSDTCAERDFSIPETKAGLAAELENKILTISDNNIQHYYRQEIRKKIKDKFDKIFWENRKSNNWKNNKKSDIRIKKPINARERMQSLILLAAIINHPSIFDEIECHLEKLEIGDITMDKLRQTIIYSLSSETSLDRDGLKMHLKAKGFERELEIILNNSIYMHANFARETSEPEIVLAGWLETWQFIRKLESQKDTKEVMESLKDADEENAMRILEMHKAHLNSSE